MFDVLYFSEWHVLIFHAWICMSSWVEWWPGRSLKQGGKDCYGPVFPPFPLSLALHWFVCDLCVLDVLFSFFHSPRIMWDLKPVCPCVHAYNKDPLYYNQNPQQFGSETKTAWYSRRSSSETVSETGHLRNDTRRRCFGLPWPASVWLSSAAPEPSPCTYQPWWPFFPPLDFVFHPRILLSICDLVPWQSCSYPDRVRLS